jgi:hypothetical protein
LDVVKHTVAATTQLAKNVLRLPLRQHFKSRFPSLNVRRLREPYATDTFFSSERSVDGSTCAQLYVGNGVTLPKSMACILKTKCQILFKTSSANGEPWTAS